MRIIIATGVYPPEIGGPSYYAVGLEKALLKAGHVVKVVHYGPLKRFPTIVRHILYAIRLFKFMPRFDAVIALDTFSVGLPAAVGRMLFGTPFIVRVGGDFLWEQYVERTGDMVPLPFFYEEHKNFTFKERLIFTLTRFVLNRAVIVFSTDWLRKLWHEAYRFNKSSAYVIENAIEEKTEGDVPSQKNFLFLTRDIRLKNHEFFRRAFQKVQTEHPDIALEEGQVSKDVLHEKMKRAYAVVLPSLSEVSPNYILDALRFGKPFILTKHSGYANWLQKYGLLVDPLDEEDMAEKIAILANGKTYKEQKKRAESFSSTRTYEEVSNDFISLLRYRESTGSRIIIVGSDRGLFIENSLAQMRQKKYGTLFEEMHIIVFTAKSDRFQKINIADNIWVYPTNSYSKFLYTIDAFRIGRRIKGDIVSTQDPFESGLSGMFISHHHSIPLHVQVHTDLVSAHFKKKSVLNRIRIVIAKWVIAKAHCIRAVSKRVGRGIEIKYRPSARVSTLPIYVDVNAYKKIKRSKRSNSPQTFVVVSRLEREKNVGLAITALYKARQLGHNARLVIVGSGSEEHTLRKMVNEWNLADCVEFVGWQDPKEYYSIADLVLVTSRYEGYGMVIVEALAAGVPALSTDVGVAHEAGAIIAKEENFLSALVGWINSGPRKGVLKHSPYKSEAEYLRMYKEDIMKCI